MKKFRLPRKTKKRLKRKFWLYLVDEKGNRLMAWPTQSQGDYTAVKTGKVKSLFDRKSKAERREYRKKMDKPITVSDEKLRMYVDDIFREDLRISSYNILIEAKNEPKAIRAYYNFVNAYHIYKNDEDSSGNVCCLALDYAQDLLKKEKDRKWRKKNR